MSFDWSDYLIVAQELASQTTASSKTGSKFKVNLLNLINRALRKAQKRSLDEARLRCAISRAYYGAFRKARNQLRDKDGQPPGLLERSGKTHQIVIDLFNQSNDLDRQLIGQFLKDLRSARNKADYDDSVPHLPGLTMTAVKYGKKLSRNPV